jgi:hypothetical protein
MPPLIKEPAVRLPVWVLPMLLGILLGLFSVIYTAGTITSKVDALKEHIDVLEQRLEQVERTFTKK